MLEMSKGDNGFWFGVVDVRRFGFCWGGDYQDKIDLGHYLWWHMRSWVIGFMCVYEPISHKYWQAHGVKFGWLGCET